jgi:hypothetical protein
LMSACETIRSVVCAIAGGASMAPAAAASAAHFRKLMNLSFSCPNAALQTGCHGLSEE